MNKYQIPNLAKACQAMSLLATERSAFTVSEVARKLEMPRTTAFRVLRTLLAEGFVEEVDGKYRSGTAILRLGLQALQNIEVHSLAEPILKDLASATGETAHLAVRTGDQMLIIQVADSPNPIRVASRPGSYVAIHCSSTGKAMLATMPQEQVTRLLSGKDLQKRTERTITTLSELENELDTIRRQGYSVDDEEFHVGVRCLAATVYDARGEAVAALGITAATIRFAKRKIPIIARDVLKAAEDLSVSLGRQPTNRSA